MQKREETRVLIYKRTHTGDPNEDGVFGFHDCMGQIRNWKFDAVIGIGGKTAWKGQTDLCRKINWIGLDPKEILPPYKRGRRFVFAHFELQDGNGTTIQDHYPHLYEYMYGSHGKRFALISSDSLETRYVFSDVKKILDSIKNSSSSKAYSSENYPFPPRECSQPNVCDTDCGCKSPSTQ